MTFISVTSHFQNIYLTNSESYALAGTDMLSSDLYSEMYIIS